MAYPGNIKLHPVFHIRTSQSYHLIIFCAVALCINATVYWYGNSKLDECDALS